MLWNILLGVGLVFFLYAMYAFYSMTPGETIGGRIIGSLGAAATAVAAWVMAWLNAPPPVG